MNDLVELAFGLFAPVPAIFEGGYRCVAVVALGGFEEEVVIALGVEGRVEIDEVNRLVLDVLAQDVEVVAVVELAHCLR